MLDETETTGRAAGAPPVIELLKAVGSNEKLTVKMPAGDYYIGDPCYVLGSNLFRALHEIIFPDHGGRDVLVSIQDGEKKGMMLDIRTLHGDGRYPVVLQKTNDKVWIGGSLMKGLAVNSGGIAVLSKCLADEEKWANLRLDFLAVSVTFAEEVTIVTHNGNMKILNYLSVITDDSETDDGDDGCDRW